MSKIDYGAWEKFIEEQGISSDEAPTVIKYKIDWNQTRKTIHITITLQKGEGIKSNVEVTFKSQHLFATVKTAKRPIIDGPTCETLRPDGCNWWLEGDKLHLELEKALEGIEWPEVIEKPGVRSNKIDRDEEARKKRQAEVEEKRKQEEAERIKTGAPTVAQDMVKRMGPASYPPREKHRPYKDNPDDAFLFQVQ